MSNESQKQSKTAAKSVRPGVLWGMLAILVILIGGVVLLKQRTQNGAKGSTTENAAGQPADSTPESGAAVKTPISASSSSAPHKTTNAGKASDTTSPTLQKLLAALNEPSLSMAERKKAIKALLHDGSPEAMAALKQALATGSKDLRNAIVQGLGECDSADCAQVLTGLLNDPSLDIARAAVKAITEQGTPQSVDILTKLLNDTSRAAELRMDAAEGLGSINQPGVLEALSNAAFTLQDDELVTQVLNALGSRDFSETQAFFNNYLHSPAISSEMRVAAIEALGQAKGDPSTFLLGLASDGDSDVRAAAAWALSTTGETGHSGAQITSLLQGESEADVRVRLYQALANQDSYDVNAVLGLLKNEKDPTALIAGLDSLARTLRDNPSADVKAFFNQGGYSQLEQLALSGKSSDDRSLAVLALARANTPESISALQDIAKQATDPRVVRNATSALGGLARK